MKIHSMTATFGKLEHATLTLKPDLNIVHAPNEWGKSTWCAFLVAMLYGIETSARTTKAALADKERFAPWSGSPMSGRMEINWNGRDITIERRTKGRLIFGDFRAYETESGIDVPELTATNCGQMLLGIERSVFLRAGFLRLSDLPVTQDDALRRRLNSLVTTGDESGTGDKLALKLKELKNKCRYNRSGLLPQAEAQRDDLQRKLNQLSELNSQQEKALARHVQLTDMIDQLENHKIALIYEETRENTEKVAQAKLAATQAEAEYQEKLQSCEGIPSALEAAQALQLGKNLQQQQVSLQREIQALPPAPQQPQIPERYQNQPPQEAVATAEADFAAQLSLEHKYVSAKNRLGLSAAVACLLGAILATIAVLQKLSFPVLAVGSGLILICIMLVVISGLQRRKLLFSKNAIFLRHEGLSPDQWVPNALEYATQQQEYARAAAANQALRDSIASRQTVLDSQIADFVKEGSLQDTLDTWQKVSQAWTALEDAQSELHQAKHHAEVLQDIVKPAPMPQKPDTLTASMDDTLALLDRAIDEQQKNRERLGQFQGQAETLGQESELRQQLKEVNQRIDRLEDTYQALELALRALSAAGSELQRRFAPRISKRAQELFSKLTGGRYQRLTLGEDLSLSAAAENEDILRSSLWRSDGTVDQLYLALRLAVAEELTPDAPLVLDDALVRFDDERLSVALEILKEASQGKQVILFTCQSREEKFI